MTWRLAPCLKAALDEANRIAPKRSKVSDGTIGDAAHSARTSDHNPDSRGIVHALDLTHDPAGGWDTHAHVERLRQRQDLRVKYLISNRRIAGPGTRFGGWEWRPYSGPNPHERHAHISVWSTAYGENDCSPWFTVPAPAPTPQEAMMRVPNAVGAVRSHDGQGVWVADRSGAVFAFRAPYIDGYNAHPEWGAGTDPRQCIGIERNAMGGYDLLFDDGGLYSFSKP